MLVSKLSGLIVPLLTPMNEDLSVDFFGLKNLTARLMNKGVRNFILFSTFSEYESISQSDQKKIIKLISGEVGSRGNVLVCCFSSSADKIIENVKFAEKYASYCVINVPFDALTNELAFVDFFDKLFRKTNTQIILYNDPVVFKRNISIVGLDRIVGWEKLFGIIDFSANPTYFNTLAYYHQSIKLFQGKEKLAVESFNHNSCGIVPALGNIVPELFVNLKNDFNEKGYNNLIRQELTIISLFDKFPKDKQIQSYKKILSFFGVIQPFFSKNLIALDDSEIQILNSLVKKSIA